MQVRKTTLTWLGLILLIIIVVGSIAISVQVKHVKKEREKERIEKVINEAIEREYQNLYSEYKHLAEIIEDSDYSVSLRHKYLLKLVKLIDKEDILRDTWVEYYRIENCVDYIYYHEDEIKQTLRLAAMQNVYNELYGSSSN